MSKIKKINKSTAVKMALILIVLLLLVGIVYGASRLISSPEEEEPSLEEVLTEKQSAYETDLVDSLGSLDTNQHVADYLLNWAKNKEIDAVADENGNVIFTVKASKGHEDGPATAIVTVFDANHMENCVEEMAVAMCIAKNAQNHGPLKVLFLGENDGDRRGALALDEGHLKDDTFVFCLGDGANSKVSTVTGGYAHFRITSKLHREQPSYDTAYRISLNHCPVQVADEQIGQLPNAIKTLGDVLANFKSTSLLFELSSFSGGSGELLTPESASMTIIIDSNDVGKFTSRMDSVIEKFYDKYQGDYPDVEYIYEEVALPKRVISHEDTENLVSLMYTAMDGVYTRDTSGNVIALTNMGSISTKDSRLQIDVAAMSCDTDVMEEMQETYETICGLCDVTFRGSEKHDLYDGNQNPAMESFLGDFEDAFRSYTGDLSMKIEPAVEFTACSILHEKKPDLPLLYCAVTEKTKYKFSGAIVTWMDQGEAEEK